MPCGNFTENMRKILFTTCLILSFFVFSIPVKAEIVTLKKDGEIIINVLSYQDSFGVVKKESLEIKDVLNSVVQATKGKQESSFFHEANSMAGDAC